MKQFLAAAFIIYGLIPQFILTMWLASEDHLVAAGFALFTLVVGIAYAICDISEDERRMTSEKKERDNVTQRSVVSL